MLTIIGLAVLGTVILGLVASKDTNDGAIGVLAGMLIGAIAGFFIAFFADICVPHEIVKVKETKLVAFQRAETGGRIFAMSVSDIKFGKTYLFYTPRSAGVEQHEVSASRIDVYESDRSDGVVKAYKLTPKGGWRLFVLNPYSPHYQLLIPKGTAISHPLKLE